MKRNVKNKKMKVGLIGFGKTGKAVASVILQNKDFCLEWVLRRSTILEHRSVPEFWVYNHKNQVLSIQVPP